MAICQEKNMAVGIYVLHLHPGEEEIRRTFLREAAEYVDPVRCKKVQRLKSTGAKAASLGAGMLLQKMALDLIDGTENTGILFLEEDELLAVLQERMHRDKAGALSFSYEYGELGKPQIVNIPKKFNLSHSGDYVVCAVGDGEVGADIQKWVPYKERTAERFLRQRNGNCCRNCLRHSARNCFTDCGAEKKPTANTPARGSAVQWEKISPTNRTGRKSRYVSGNGFWRIAIRWRSVTEQQKRKR